jgi:hydroxyacylglutathione hydrolase
LYQSLKKFSSRPDWLQIWPGHGAGSSCGKGISAIPQSTLGYEKRFNWAFRAETEDAFVAEVLAGQPDPPKYFAEMKKMNRDGPKVLGGFPRPSHRSADALEPLIRHGAVVIDTRRASDYAVGHIPGTINIPWNGSFTNWAGWLIPYAREFFVIVDDRPNSIDGVVRDLSMIGLDHLSGYFDAAAIDWWASAGHRLGTIAQIESADLAESLKHDGVTLIDVRSDAEWGASHIGGARHVPLGHLAERASDIPRGKPVVLQCAGGGRSSIAASVLRARGFDQVINLAGGLSGWIKDGLPTET